MQFYVRALRPTCPGVVAMQIDAMSEEDARLQAERQGYQVLQVKTAGWFQHLRLIRTTSFPLVLFSQELVALLRAGLSLMESLETLAEKERNQDLIRVYQGLLMKLREGLTLSAAMEQFPSSFSPLYVATVRASERTGDMPEALNRYVVYQGQLDQVRKKLVSASIYPMVLLAVGSLVLLFLLMYVVPKFSRLYEDVHGELPLMSQLLLEWGRLLERHGSEATLFLLGGLAAVVFVVTRRETHEWIRSRVRALPSLQHRFLVYDLARFYRTLGMLLRGGMPVVQALGMSATLLPAPLRAKLARATTAIKEGQALSSAMERNDLTTPVALRMLRVGERTGQMGDMMERIAAFYDEEIARWVDWAGRLIEPVLMAVIGLVIGTIVVLMYFPIFELAGSLQ